MVVSMQYPRADSRRSSHDRARPGRMAAITALHSSAVRRARWGDPVPQGLSASPPAARTRPPSTPRPDAGGTVTCPRGVAHDPVLTGWSRLTAAPRGWFAQGVLLRAMIDRRGHIDLRRVASALCPCR
ncbi:hypothetical protein GTS_42360 [Gandjariella thermophila]|uniref:Uncharacterized protein n=1 Tax=Gandjariella thermophila TaxID=1931992 RepID=A0A4D4JFE8_9PSEU|nr:hypothetical protein GTS_42360 [Gandjariella thermophila]